MDDQRPADIPSGLRQLIQLNVAYRVLLCPHPECRKAVQPRAFSEHTRVQHKAPLRDREQIQAYVKGINWEYDFSTISLPRDGSRPQQTIPVVDGFQCRACPFKSSNRKAMKVHGNREHGQQRVDDAELFREVRLQSWFQDHRQRYWVVDESKTEDGGVEVRPGEGGDSGLRARDRVARGRADERNDPDEEVGAVEAGDEEVARTVGESAVVGVVVVREAVEAMASTVREDVEEGDGEEVFSAFDDSEDQDYRESSEDVVESSEGSSEEGVDQSDDEYEPRSGGPDDDEGPWSEIEVDIEAEGGDDGQTRSGAGDDDREQVGRTRPAESQVGHPGRERRARKRKMQERGESIDSEGNTSREASPRPGGGRGRATKRRRGFDDSGVVMGSSEGDDEGRSSSPYDGVVPPSSPPVWRRTGSRRPGAVGEALGFPDLPGGMVEVVDDTSGFPETRRAMVEVVHDDGGSSGSQCPPRRLDQLRARLERWCQTCPACHLARGLRSEAHSIEGCRRRDTVELVEQAAVIQQHVETSGGFRGQDGCSRCGVPRAICPRWQVDAGGEWEEVAGQPCRYTGLVAAVVTMWMDGSAEGWAVAGGWMDRDGVVKSRPAEVFEWLRQEGWWEDIRAEVARVVRVFHMLVNKNRG